VEKSPAMGIFSLLTPNFGTANRTAQWRTMAHPWKECAKMAALPRDGIPCAYAPPHAEFKQEDTGR
jgi:hypothetical protein